MRKLIGAIFIIISIAGAAFASEIRPKEYSYPCEFAVSTTEPAFVVCDICTPRRSLEPAPKGVPAVISIKLSEAGPPNPEPSGLNVNEKGHEEKQERALTDTSLIVYFDFDSFTLHTEEKEKLKTAPSLFKGDVIVTGYTCDIGSEGYNRRLSLKRAKAVEEYLSQLGVAPREITGKGKCRPVSNKRELNRRVEIKEAR